MNMIKRHLTLLLVALGIGGVAVWAGAPINTVLLLGVVLMCPLMMIFMMATMHGGDEHSDHAHAGRRGTGDSAGAHRH